MKITKVNGIRVLTPELGKIIRNKETGSCSVKIYLGENASEDIYEEINDDYVSVSLKQGILELQNRERSLIKIGKLFAKSVTDDEVALYIREFYDDWEEGILYKVGTYVNYKGVLYKTLTEHTSQSDWTPDISSSLFSTVLVNLDGTPNEWVQPDSTNGYMIGDRVIFEGSVYESIIDNNIWSPSAYPNGWKLV